jgi:steroid 5-alpha reductase family enzyme
MQNGILYGLGYPTYIALRNPNTPLGPIDAVLTGLVALDLLIEFTADNQQYSFQTFKHSKAPRVQKAPGEEWFFAKQRWTEDDVKTGFVTRGLWAWSRHPNFAAEQTFWVHPLSRSPPYC